MKKTMPRVQHRVAPRPKQCPICKKPVTKADFDGKKAKYANVARRSELGLRWQHLDCERGGLDARSKSRPRSRD